ncbi:uncharacterized protein LOC130564862 [Triplophysa rosa]|uniref:uncharacterized protein LOC130564862 n=1 Tax=Triplophysa rosa TaxID=992332 RepID=UPI0025463089|nr:uncharacterized protein LOC130564862 [Triplophysa rosa]
MGCTVLLLPLVISLLPGCLPDDTVDITTLSKIQNYIHYSYEKGEQFAVAINVPKEQCKDGYDESSFLKDDKGEDVKPVIGKNNNNIYNGKELIAAGTTKDGHSEFLLMADNGGISALESLLKKREAGCVIFYTLLSPCIDGCLQNENILSGLEKLKEFTGIKAFVYTHIYDEDKNKNYLQNELMKIADYVPLYRCGPRVGNTCVQCGSPGIDSSNFFPQLCFH